jgi:hypothetical protein
MIVYISSYYIAYIASYNLFVSTSLHESTLTLPYEFVFFLSANSINLHTISVLCIVTYNNSKLSKKIMNPLLNFSRFVSLHCVVYL